jgi:malate dehydrogenase
MSARRKVTVVGAGNVGATCAQVLATRDYADLVLVDIKEGLPQGKALDINQMGAVLGYEPNVTGSNGYEESAGSEVVVITAGLPRSPGMSRDDLVATNEKIVKDVTEKVIAQSPNAILIVVSNPLDAMCHVAKNVSGWPKERVFGMAGILDTARFSTFIAWETGASLKDVRAMVLGGHGDQMVSVVSATTVGGVPLRKLVAEPQIQAMVERTAKGGGADGRLDHARREARAPVHRLSRGRVRDRRPLHGRAVQARPEGHRADHRARPLRRRTGGAAGKLRSRTRSRRRPHDLNDAGSARDRRRPPGGHRLRDLSKGALAVATATLADELAARGITGQVIDSEGGFRRTLQ